MYELLSEVLWAYRTSQKTSTWITPYILVFVYDAMIPVELIIQSLKRAKQLSISLNDYRQAMMANLDDLDEVHLLVQDHLVPKKKQMEWMYNKEV